MAEPKQELIETYPEIYYDYDYDAEIKKEQKPKRKTTKKKTKKKTKAAGCPPGYKDVLGQCLHPEIQKINEKAEELKKQADKLERAWKDAVNFSTGRIPFAGQTKKLNIIGRLFDENIEDLKNIKRKLFW